MADLKKPSINDFSLEIATVNGSGSQSANAILAKTFFRMGLAVGSKNLFPSNISGQPTWFTIRVHPDGFVGRRLKHEIVIAYNAETASEDLKSVCSGGHFFYDQSFKLNPSEIREDVTCVPIPFREIGKDASDSIKMRKLLSNMIYVGILAELLNVDAETLKNVVKDHFQSKPEVGDLNFKVIEAAGRYARENLAHLNFPHSVRSKPGANKEKIFIDGNSAAALGSLVGGCTFLSWYPITPATSLAEQMQDFVGDLRDKEKRFFASVQAEDELGAINMVLGAGWAGCRAMTTTSGPGLSLMAEAAGLSYFSEIPAVIWDVQRVGPSTGLPTRTLQSDVLSAARLSHGDTEHIVLIPAHPGECYQFAQLAFDLAEEFQTLVIVLSDLDVGMNSTAIAKPTIPTGPYQRGKVLTAEDLAKLEAQGKEFARYRDIDGDGIPYRTLPGTAHLKAAYFTRGTSHTETSAYSENGDNFKNLMNRLKKKFQTARKRLPQPHEENSKHSVGIVAYGSTDMIMPEVRSQLKARGLETDYLRLKSLPLSDSISEFCRSHEVVYVIEQNRDAQMLQLLTQSVPSHAARLRPILTYDGLPIAAEAVSENLWLAHKEGSR